MLYFDTIFIHSGAIPQPSFDFHDSDFFESLSDRRFIANPVSSRLNSASHIWYEDHWGDTESSAFSLVCSYVISILFLVISVISGMFYVTIKLFFSFCGENVLKYTHYIRNFLNVRLFIHS